MNELIKFLQHTVNNIIKVDKTGILIQLKLFDEDMIRASKLLANQHSDSCLTRLYENTQLFLIFQLHTILCGRG